MNLVPLKDKVIVRQITEKIESKSGIVIPETVSADLPQKGEVIAVGSGKVTAEGKLLPMEVKVGDKVLFARYSPTTVEHDGEKLLIISESDVLAIIK